MTISQREARRLKRQVRVFEDAERRRRRVWGTEYPGGAQVASAKWEALQSIPVAIRTARKLGHAVVALANDDGEVRFIALPDPKADV
jgi:hypothetical protein